MALPEIIITVAGMGDPDPESTLQWSQSLFPGSALVSQGGRTRLELLGRTIHLLEVRYEEHNEAIRSKIETLGAVLADSGLGDEAKNAIEDHVLDVFQNVLVPASLDAAQQQFAATYTEALTLARELLGPEQRLSRSRIGVLAHSLGSYVAYEGLCRVFDDPMQVNIVDVNLVLCAPMLAPIHAVLSSLRADRYLTRYQGSKPTQQTATGRTYSIFRRCLAIYDRRDPFYLIHSPEFYRREDADLVDEMVLYGSRFPRTQFWRAHGMSDSYIHYNRERIASWLL